MAHVCPWWMGYLLVNPLRRFLENPGKILAPLIAPGDTVVEPGCGMGYFTLPAARLAGERGRVVALDVQEKMLAGLRRRARRAGLERRIETRLVDGGGLKLSDFSGLASVALALHVVHELPDQAGFFRDLAGALAPGGRLLFMEPKGHVSAEGFAASLKAAEAAGLSLLRREGPLKAILQKVA